MVVYSFVSILYYHRISSVKSSWFHNINYVIKHDYISYIHPLPSHETFSYEDDVGGWKLYFIILSLEGCRRKGSGIKFCHIVLLYGFVLSMLFLEVIWYYDFCDLVPGSTSERLWRFMLLSLCKVLFVCGYLLTVNKIIIRDTWAINLIQVPQFLLDYMWGKGEACKIVCTQPRRISAVSGNTISVCPCISISCFLIPLFANLELYITYKITIL